MKTNFKLLVFLVMATLMFFFAACKKSTPPTVTISNNISVTQTSANVTGEVTNEGSSSVTERGFIYGKQGESRQDTMYCGSGVGEFPTRLTGLEPNTTYNCSAFAKNDGGIGTSGKVTFTTRDYNLPMVSTSEVENMGTTTASCGGNVTDDGGAEVTERGVCWATNHSPVVTGSHAMSGSGLGEFTCNMINLVANTTYYVRAYAKNVKGVAYGEEKNFTTLDKPTVSTGAVTNITTSSATGNGSIVSNGGNAVTEQGFCWSTSHNPSITGTHVVAEGDANDFSAALTNLSPNTTYYVRAYATNGTGTAYGDEVQFTTLSISVPGVTTASVTNIGNTTATGGGNVVSNGGATVTERGICWSTSHNPTISGSHANSGTGLGEFTVSMNNLTPNTTYYVRAYAINSQGTAYGEEVNFKTSQTSTYTVGVSANPANGGTVTGGGTYEQGQPCTVRATAATGYIFQKWTENGTQVSTNANYTFTVTSNRSLVAHFAAQPQVPTGAINGKFSVSAGRRVYFSQGNLQYKASTGTWRFAEHQWDFVGGIYEGNEYGNVYENGVKCDNSLISSYYSGWIDLFGWGTSGWNPGGNTYYHPWDYNYDDDHLYGPPGRYNLTGSYANSDWGYYNAISNGGNTVHQWRTLTHEEWDYVFNTRSTSSGIRYAKATVNGVKGVILLPDEWSTSYYSLSKTNESNVNFSFNVISSSDWTNCLQAHGAVFLPMAGFRNMTTFILNGFYWMASYSDSNDPVATYYAYSLFFNSAYLRLNNGSYRGYGHSVRLVCPAE